MSDITYNLSYRLSKGNLANNVQVANVTANMTVGGFQSLTFDLTTNTTAIATSNLAAVGLAFLQNLATATAATAQLGSSIGGTFAPFTTLRPGESALVRLSAGTNYQARGAAEAAARIRVDITEG